MASSIIGVIVVGVSIIVGIGARFIFKKKDHPVEQIAEKILKDQTGIDIDFTPEEKPKVKKKEEKAVKK